ncbi:MAG: ATP-binding protein [Planctomycetes bacterium]|nr:ATP-binding protein [Planctomycetota bacterium]
MSRMSVSPEAIAILRDLNPWWETGKLRTPAPRYHRRGVDAILQRLKRGSKLIEVLRGPRQVGKTTAIEQALQYLLNSSVRNEDILFVRFDQEVLRETQGGLRPIVSWYQQHIRKRPFEKGPASYLFLDEIHKLDRWDSETKDFGDTFPVRIVLTGSSSVLVAKGGRESLAGRVFVSEMPTFQFREVLEAWYPIAQKLPRAHPFESIFETDLREIFQPFNELRGQQKHSLRRHLEKYYNRGGYPKLYNGEVGDDIWADYLTQTIFDRVLGVDVPDLFPVRNPRLLRWLYVEIARSTGQEIKQLRLTEYANEQGFATSQPLVGNYLHYLADALLIREFRRYPIAKRASARTPAKITLTDLGARNAVFRGAPSLWESSPDHVGPLIETLAQSILHGPNLQVHFYRDYSVPGNRKSPLMEVDFVVEAPNGDVVPVEIKFRQRIENKHFAGLVHFMDRYKAKHGIMVTRDTYQWSDRHRILCVPLMDFLLAF